MRCLVPFALLIGMTTAALASEGFDLVIPGRPGVPIIINGIDVSYAVVESDFGLGKGVRMQPRIYGGRLVEPMPPVGHYYPTLGHKPGYGRAEIEPPSDRRLPQPAESFYRSYSSRSEPLPDSTVPANPPPVIVAPEMNLDGERLRPR